MGLFEDVAERLLAQDLDAHVTALALAACRGPEDLAGALAAGSADLPDLDLDEDDAAAGGAVHLRAVAVEGFRGIGARARLELPPGPGLTLVVGRNGSGKSSFAEAVELALTGDNRRWSSRSKVWRDGWRNLHHAGPAEVRGEFAVEGRRQPVAVRRRWDADADLADATLAVEGADADDLDDLGWASALELYRPFLPYSELGAMVDEGPTALHDALSAVLGLDLLTGAAKVLRDARLTRERAWKGVVGDAADLAAELAEVDDERARTAADLLAAKQPDVEAVAGLLGDEDPTAGPGLDVLRQLAGLAGPDLDAVRRAADRLDDAARAAAATRGSDAARDLEVAELLGRARHLHDEHGDGDCPVCGVGALDGEWAARAGRLEEQLRTAAAEVEATRRELVAARGEVAGLARAVPAVLRRAGLADVDASLATATWEELQAVVEVEDDRERAVALRKRAEAVTNALADLRQRCRAALVQREDQWRPHATRVSAWVARARDARDEATAAPALKAAEKGLAAVHDEVRAERWEPIAEHAKQVWEQLRQASNVAIDDVALAGTGNRRRVEVTVTVDGVEGAALGVMSQGELHALALSLFLPRATLPESPFRFLVIDDPVQSMDPARVDGLARVLGEVATDRQVVVFTHDDRLPEAVRRLQVPANVLEVTRGRDSAVEVRHASSPWERHLDDARALARSEGLPRILRARSVPGFCRLALEAAAADAVRRRDLAAGHTHAEVEAALEATPKLLPRLALAILGDAGRGGEVLGRLNAMGRWAGDAVRACNAGAHEGHDGDLGALVDDVAQVVRRQLVER